MSLYHKLKLKEHRAVLESKFARELADKQSRMVSVERALMDNGSMLRSPVIRSAFAFTAKQRFEPAVSCNAYSQAEDYTKMFPQLKNPDIVHPTACRPNPDVTLLNYIQTLNKIQAERQASLNKTIEPMAADSSSFNRLSQMINAFNGARKDKTQIGFKRKASISPEYQSIDLDQHSRSTGSAGSTVASCDSVNDGPPMSKKVKTSNAPTSWLAHYLSQSSPSVQRRSQHEQHGSNLKERKPSQANAEHIWNLTVKASQQKQLMKTAPADSSETNHVDSSFSEENPLICAICGDKSSGLHYGIYTCEGCKGFFKRTVQGKRVYSCVSGMGHCPMTKEQRNRCQYCRFQKCLQQGMVLEAVREDRMPGGRNGSAIYDLYKLKYKKSRRIQALCERIIVDNLNPPQQHKANSNTNFGKQLALKSSMTKFVDNDVESTTFFDTESDEQPLNLTKSKTTDKHADHDSTLSSHQDFRPDSSNSQPCKTLIHELMENDKLSELIFLKSLYTESTEDACTRLENIGDEIVEKLVEWTKKLPIYKDLPVDVYSQLLTKQWAELVLLSTAFYCCYIDDEETFSFTDHKKNLSLLRDRLSVCMKREIPVEYIEREAGVLVKTFTSLAYSLKKLKLGQEAYVCLKAITLLHQGDLCIHPKVTQLQDQFVKVLRIHLSQSELITKLTDILAWLPLLHSVSTVLLSSKMLYVPFLLCNKAAPVNGESNEELSSEPCQDIAADPTSTSSPDCTTEEEIKEC